jgi:histidinol-phosphate aminotransferase
MTNFDPARSRAPHLAGVDAYHPIPAVAHEPGVLKLDLNECPLPPSPRVTEALRNALAQPATLNWYPDPTCTALRAAISGYIGLPADHVLVTNGSNQAMEVIARSYLAPGDAVLIAAPVYGVFKLQCQLHQAHVTEFYFRDPFAPAIDELLAAPGVFKAIFIANPNNPTGAGLRRSDVVAVLQRHPEALLVLDEAYAEFHDQPCPALVAEFANLVVLRSFSKAFALAGVRCGYVLAQPATLAPLTQVFPPWSVSTITQVAATTALADAEHMRELTGECRAARQAMVIGLAELGYAARNTAANFILWQVSDPAKVQQQLAARGVYVSNKDGVPQLRGFLRVTVGNRLQARQFLATVAATVGPAR